MLFLTRMRGLDLANVDRLVASLLAGKQTAWPALVDLLFPALEAFAGASRSMGPLRQSVDHRRSAATEILGRLSRNQYRSLASLPEWRAAHPGKTTADWLRIVATNVIRDYVTQQLGAAPKRADRPSAGKRLMNTLAEALPADDEAPALRPKVTDQQAARTILAAAREILSPEQAEVLNLWLRGADGAEIARELGLADGAAAFRLMRAALARLRHRFA